MAEGKKTTFLISVLIVLTAASMVMSGYALMSDDSEEQYDGIRYTMFLGMNDRTDEEIDVIQERMIELITSTGNGYTLERESGGYVLDGKVFRDDVSLKFVVINAKFSDIEWIVDSFKTEFDQDLIYMEQEDVHAGFF